MPTSPELLKIQREFMRLLEEARRSIASRPQSDGSGSHKSLAAELRISPARIGNFLDEEFQIEIAALSSDNVSKPFSPPRLRKSVAGFAASVERALFWLRRQKLLSDSSLDTAAVVKSYWPPDHIDEFDHRIVQDGIEEGQTSARQELQNLLNIKVERWVLAWGPFGTQSQIETDAGFLLAYARDLIKGVDPFADLIPPLPKPLTEILDLPFRDRKKGLALATGVCETLYRQFLGFEFVKFPMISFPIVCLLVSRTKPNGGELKLSDLVPEADCRKLQFSDFVSGTLSTKHVRLAAIKGDMGEALLLSLLANQQDRIIDEEIGAGSPTEIAQFLSEAVDDDERPLALFSDCIAAFDAFVRLRNNNADLHVEVISQSTPSPAFVFSLGIMLRKEDKDVASLLERSQRQILQSDWRVQMHISNLVEDVEKWLAEQRFDEGIGLEWPENVPVFQIDLKTLKRYIAADGDGEKASALVEVVRERVEHHKKKSASNLLKHLIGYVNE